jgi:hypothetical protein
MEIFFKDTDELRRYVQGVDGSMSMDALKPAFMLARKAVADTVGEAVFDALSGMTEEPVFQAMRFATANYAMYKHLIFWSVSRGGDQQLYKYQYEEMKDEYISQFWAAMDTLLLWLDSNPETGGYGSTDLYTERQQMPVRNALEFDRYYGIDRSPYFYSKVLFLMRKIVRENILPRTGDLSKIEDERLLERIRRCLCWHVMAEAVMKFDLTELPRSIRWDLTHEFSKTGSQMQVREKLYSNLMSEVDNWYTDIEASVRLLKGASDRAANSNEERNKYYVTL